MTAVIPWFGTPAVEVTLLAENVAYTWGIPSDADPETHVPTINDLIIWHDCDHNRWVNDPTKDQTLIPMHNGWHPTGVGAHDLITVDPLHIEASVYWPDCCGMHGFIRDGRWIGV